MCKYRLFEALRARSSAVLPLSKLEQLDLDYHDVANGALYASLLRRGALRSLIDGREAQKARTMPPVFLRLDQTIVACAAEDGYGAAGSVPMQGE